LAYSTIPLVPIVGEGEEARRNGLGSGVLVELDSRYFIVTAGHCVRDFTHSKIALGVARGRHNFQADIIDRDQTYETHDGSDPSSDVGYLEIPGHQGKAAESYWRVALKLAGFVNLDLPPGQDEQGLFVCGGFPDALAEEVEPTISKREETINFIYFYSGYYNEEHPSEIHPPDRFFSLRVPSSVHQIEGPGKRRTRPMPDLSGVSGGGVWHVDLRDLDEGFTESSMKLAGLHVATFKRNSDPVCLRAIKATEALRLIAKKNPDLAERTDIEALL